MPGAGLGWEEGECGSARSVPALSTDAPPGSPDKVEVMRRRWAANEHLHHPGDYLYRPESEGDRFLLEEGWRLVLVRSGGLKRRRSTPVRFTR